MENLSLMDRFSDSAMIDQLSASEKLQGSLITTLMGMGLTFVVLALLWGIIAVTAKLLNKDTANTMTAATPAPVAPVAVGINPMDDSQLVAVIMAAIAASEGKEFKNNLVVRKINRISGQTPAWRNAGQVETIDSRRI